MHDFPLRLGPYAIRREIGSGGMGVVYEGWDARLARRVAVKTLWPSLAQRTEARERFLREARAAAAVSHPNVTQIYDIGEENGVVYFAMEYLDAPSLQEVLSTQGPLGPARVVAIARQAALGLKAAAERGIVHRDVKPSNLVIAVDGTVKVTDFGLAKQAIVDENLTLEGQTIGTPKYLSPEQASGSRVDARSDIYSLGVTMYEMVSGKPPFDGANPMEVMLKQVREPVPPLTQARPGVPRPLAGLIHRMLAKQPAARPRDYDELIRMLDHVEQASEEPSAKPDSTVVFTSVATAPAAGGNFAGRLFALALAGLVVVGGMGLLVRSLTSREDGPVRTAAPTGSRAPEFEEPRGGETGNTLGTAVPSEHDALPPSFRSVESESAELEIVEARHEFTEDGRMIVTGAVANSGSARAMRTKVRISLTDASGELLNSTEVFVHPERLAQGEQGRFEAVFPDPAQSVKIVFELNWIS